MWPTLSCCLRVSIAWGAFKGGEVTEGWGAGTPGGLWGLQIGVRAAVFINSESTMPFWGFGDISEPVMWSYAFTPKRRFSHNDCTMTLMGLCCFGSAGLPATRLFLNCSLLGGATQVTGSFITPQVRLMGPEGLKGLLLKGRISGIGFDSSAVLVGFLSRALRR